MQQTQTQTTQHKTHIKNKPQTKHTKHKKGTNIYPDDLIQHNTKHNNTMLKQHKSNNQSTTTPYIYTNDTDIHKTKQHHTNNKTTQSTKTTSNTYTQQHITNTKHKQSNT